VLHDGFQAGSDVDDPPGNTRKLTYRPPKIGRREFYGERKLMTVIAVTHDNENTRLTSDCCNCTGHESVPKIIINDTLNLFFKLQLAFWYFETITVSECF